MPFPLHPIGLTGLLLRMAGFEGNWVFWLVFANLAQARVSREERTSGEELAPSCWPMGMCVRGISSISD